MSQAANQAMPTTDIEAAHIRHMLAEAVDSVQATDAENGAVAAHYQIAGRFDDGALQAHVKDMIAALSPMPASLITHGNAQKIAVIYHDDFGVKRSRIGCPDAGVLPVKIAKAAIFSR